MTRRYTRIILIGDDDQGVREYTISHRMVWLLGILGLLLAAALMVVFFNYGTLLARIGHVDRIEADLLEARAEVAVVDSLRAELVTLTGMQHQLLAMLGITTQEDDSLAVVDSRLTQLARIIQTPPPDAWPAAGYATREFVEGQTTQGVLPHHGLDIAGPEGAPILAAGDGVVVRAGTEPHLGNFVEIQHGMGYLTVYGHCRQVAVTRGAQVRRGQIVAYMGTTGEATAPHLHFEIWHHGEAVDPRRFLQGEPPSP